MSLWLSKRNADGRVHYYAVPFDPTLFLISVGICLGLSLPLVFALRDATRHRPTEVVAAIALTLAAGMAMLAVAKASVIRRGVLISFGPGPMTRGMRRLYFAGYGTMGCAILLTMLFLALAGT